MTLRFLVVAPALLGLAACSERPDRGPVVVSAIGGSVSYGDPQTRPIDPVQRYLADSTAQGLVRFDAAGQIEPGLAERWIVIDDGRTYIFRLRAAEWPDGSDVTAGDVVRILTRALAPGSRNPLKPFLSAVSSVVEMTPQVIEIRLSRPRPDLLKLFAQPELAILRTEPRGGSGPFRAIARAGIGVLLRPAFDPSRSPDDDEQEPGPERNVVLIGEPAAHAVYRFVHRQSDLVVAGTVADWPILSIAKVPPANVRLDPAAGLFGLAVLRREGFLADPAGRAAIAQAIDRGAVLSSFTSDWPAVERLLPDTLDSAAAPATPSWAQGTAETRLDAARATVAAWRAAHDGAAPAVRIAFPPGSGGTKLYAEIGRNLIAAGIRPIRVGWRAGDADLRLIDVVAPYDSARWYLALACQACSPDARSAIDAARDAETLDERARHIAEADAALAADIAYIPIAAPLRWSLVSRRLKQWQGNARAWHPLNHLRNDTN